LAGLTAQAQTTNWTGGTNADWNIPGNWSLGTVPTATNDVVISVTAMTQPVLSTTAVAKSVHVQSGASLSISSAGSLTINDFATLGGFTNAFYNQGTVTNGGTLILGNTAPVGLMGLRNTGTFTNTGTLQVDRATNQGINNGATFTNTGTIRIGASVSMGTQGIWNQATFTHTGGTITIDRITGDGLLNSGNFTNSATITIGASASVASLGISNSGSFSSITGGIIQIDRTGSTAIVSSSTFVNAAIIKIGSLTTVNGAGIQVNGGTFTNNPGGNININRTGTGGNGISRDGVLNGAGATFTNSSTLTIGDIAFVAQDNIFNRGTFNNTATGEINLDRAVGFGNGIWNGGSTPSSGSFQNAGRIVLGANAVTGSSGILNTTTFTNTTGGNIVIDRCNGNALNNAGVQGIFTNAARIRIGQNFTVGNHGLANSASAVFRNNAGGDITIDRTGNDGLANLTSATLVNSAIITIGLSGSVGNDGIDNSATISNSACAVLTVFDNINNSNSFTNDGLFTVNTGQAHTNSALTNNGVIVYPQGNPIPNVTNNDLIVGPINSCTTVISPALQIGGMNSFSASTTWYTDASLITPAGTYNQATNTLTLTTPLPGNSAVLYFAATDNVNGCTRTVSVSVSTNAFPPTVTLIFNNATLSATNNNFPVITLNNGVPATFQVLGGALYELRLVIDRINGYEIRQTDANATGVFTVNRTGPYTITVTDASGCSRTVQGEIRL